MNTRISLLLQYSLSSKICVPNKTEDVNVDVLNMITRRNESVTLTEHILYDCKCKFVGRKFNLNQMSNEELC